MRRRRCRQGPVRAPVILSLAAASLLAWAVLLFRRGGFWRADQTLADPSSRRDAWPAVVAVVPARNEAATIGQTVTALRAQDYPGSLSVIVVDDDSDDATGEAALAGDGKGHDLAVIRGRPLAAGWAGKPWAMSQGVRRAAEIAPEAAYILFTDADIVHDRRSLRRLVDRAERDGLDLVSLMVLLRCESPWERLLIPAFVFFFQKLYPFPWVNDGARATAAAAGGCMLVRRRALAAVGGMEAIRDRLIDDCALARIIKKRGSIWLGLSGSVRSMRSYDGLAGIWRMVARSAFEQLGYKVAGLVPTVAGMGLLYIAPPATVAIGALVGDAVGAAVGGLAWVLMARAYGPTLSLYGQARWRAALLPLAALFYALMTVDSVRRGGASAWKGRAYGKVTKGNR